MNARLRSFGVIVILLTLGVSTARLRAAAPDVPPASPAAPAGAAQPAVVDEATRKKIDQKATRLVDAIRLDEAGKAARVRTIVSEWLAVMLEWHKANDAELSRLWGEWNKARAIVPKDEFPGEVIAHQIDDVYTSLKPAYDDYLKRLSAELTPEQVDALKEQWSRSPGMTRTYNAYLEIVPDLTEKDKEVIKNRMLMAREAAMLTDADKEIVAIYKRHKVKVEQYVGTLQWAKLHKAFAERGKAKSDEKNTDEPAKTTAVDGAAAPAK